MSDDSIVVKPAPGRLVRDPQTLQKLAEAGERKPRDSYWLRRLRDGDVLEMSVAKPARKDKE